jgi:SAM-dependent methyltransferase
MNALSPISLLINHRRWKYRWRYLRRQTPWETDETPAEVLELLKATLPGKALDLGCGAGTHALTLARHGWEVAGIVFSDPVSLSVRKKGGPLPGTGTRGDEGRNGSSFNQTFEESFVNRLQEEQVNAIASFTAIPGEARPTEANIRAAVKAGRFDAVLLTHLVGVEQKEIYHPPT